MKRPNVIFVFSDQHRAQALGYAGDPNVKTPAMDRLAEEGICFTLAVSGMPVCCPYRATFMTGQYPHHHGVFLNDLCLTTEAKCIGQAFLEAGYDTAYIGKWHLNGHGRQNPVPAEQRMGFLYWKVQECTHDYFPYSISGNTAKRIRMRNHFFWYSHGDRPTTPTARRRSGFVRCTRRKR